MTCPGCGKEIPINEWLDYPARFFTKANDGAVWHYLCVGRILREWRERNENIRAVHGEWVAEQKCEHCKHVEPSDKTNRLFCSYHSEGEYQREIFKDDYCNYFELAEANREDLLP